MPPILHSDSYLVMRWGMGGIRDVMIARNTLRGVSAFGVHAAKAINVTQRNNHVVPTV